MSGDYMKSVASKAGTCAPAPALRPEIVPAGREGTELKAFICSVLETTGSCTVEEIRVAAPELEKLGADECCALLAQLIEDGLVEKHRRFFKTCFRLFAPLSFKRA